MSGNAKNVQLAGCRKKYNRAQREVESLRKLFKETESSDIAEKLVSAEKRLSDAHSTLMKVRATV